MTTDSFETFVEQTWPRLFRALLPRYGPHGAEDATAEAVAYAWEHWDRLQLQDNPAGYLYRVAQSRSRRRRTPFLPAPAAVGLPEIEPRLIEGLRRLSDRQRSCIWLVHGCGWTHAETAEALGLRKTTVSNHVSRALGSLRRALGEVE